MAWKKNSHEDWDEDEFDSDEFDGEDDDPETDWSEDDSEIDATIPCPECGRPIYDDSPHCPYCEHYLSEEAETPTRRPMPLWLIVGFIGAFFAAILWAFFG